MGIWRGGWRMFLDHPVLGVGYGRRAFRDHWTFPSPPPLDTIGDLKDMRFGHAHNAWVHLLATQGVLGWAAFHFLYVAVVVLLLKRVRAVLPEEIREHDPETAAGPGFFRTWAARSMTVPGVVLLGMVFLQFNGLMHLPLQESNEILSWALAAVGLAATQFAQEPVREGAPAKVNRLP
jgi:O-antigen ligase